MRIRLAVVAQPGAAADAVIGPRTHGNAGDAWSGSCRELLAFCRAGRVVGAGAVLDGALSARWGRLVACTPEFSRWWESRAGRPRASFFLEVLA